MERAAAYHGQFLFRVVELEKRFFFETEMPRIGFEETSDIHFGWEFPVLAILERFEIFDLNLGRFGNVEEAHPILASEFFDLLTEGERFDFLPYETLVG